MSVEEARERILAFLHVLEPERKPILDALGQVLAEDIEGHFDIPPLANSAMDGYAVQATSVAGASPEHPMTLRVTGIVAAGHLPTVAVETGTAVRIMTGAAIPDGADAVVPFEDTDEVERRASSTSMDTIGVNVAVPIGVNVRPAGQDVSAGQQVLQKGAVLRAQEIGVLASLGYGEVSVIRRPEVSILATGDELVDPACEPRPGGIYDSNSYSIASAVRQAGGVPHLLGIAGDNVEAIGKMLKQGLASDILITSAGVSKGDYDVVKDVLARQGDISFWSVRMRPAKPIAFGTLAGPDGRRVPHLGLPGNPVSTLVGFEQFGRPAIAKMLGKGDSPRPTVQAILEEDIDNFDGRRVYARVQVVKREGVYYAKLTGHQSSNLLTSMTRANGLAICLEDTSVKKTGEQVTVQMIDWPENVF